jgi:hypothetical protein
MHVNHAFKYIYIVLTLTFSLPVTMKSFVAWIATQCNSVEVQWRVEITSGLIFSVEEKAKQETDGKQSALLVACFILTTCFA